MKTFFLRHVDVSTAWKAALLLGLVVYAMNISHGALAALPAALKQATYTFFVAGFIVRLCENLVDNKDLDALAFPSSVVIPFCIAVSLTLLLHSLTSQPEPFCSTAPLLPVRQP